MFRLAAVVHLYGRLFSRSGIEEERLYVMKAKGSLRAGRLRGFRFCGHRTFGSFRRFAEHAVSSLWSHENVLRADDPSRVGLALVRGTRSRKLTLLGMWQNGGKCGAGGARGVAVRYATVREVWGVPAGSLRGEERSSVKVSN